MAVTLGTRWYAPIDFGVTEAIQKATGQRIGDYNPRQNMQTPGLDYRMSKPTVTTLNQGGAIIPGINASFPKDTPIKNNSIIEEPIGVDFSSKTNGLVSGDDGGGGINIESLLQAQRDLARRVYEEGITRARNAYNQARSIFDEGVGNLNKRREQFKSDYDAGNADILSSTDQSRGNLQAADAGNRTRMLNSLRAMGMGGSAYLRGEGARQQQNAQQLGNLNLARTASERDNLRSFNTNQDWASGQESELNRYLQGAGEAQRAAEAQSGLIEQGDSNSINNNISSYIQSIIDNQNALAATRGGVGSYAGNSFSVDLPSMLNTLNTNLSANMAGTGSSPVGNNVALLPSSIDQIRKRAGGSLYA